MERRNRNHYAFRCKRMPGDGYDSDCETFRESLLAGLIHRIRPGIAAVMRAKMKLSSFCESFFLTRLLSRFAQRFLKTRVRSTSVGVLCFGFLCAAITLFRMVFEQITPSSAVTDLAFSLGVVIGTLPLALCRSTWSQVLSRSLLGAFFFDLLGGFRDEELIREGEHAHGGRFSVIAGVVLGLCCFFRSPVFLAFAFLVACVAALVFYKPELGLSLIALLFAFLTEEALLVLSAMVLLSFVWKALRGKRVVLWEPVDLFALFLFLIWAGGIGFGLSKASTVVLGAMLYFLFAKLVTTSGQARRLSYVFVIGLFLFSLLFFIRLWADGGEGDLPGRIGALLFAEKGGFVVPLDIVMMLLPIAAVGAIQKGAAKLFSVASLALGLCTLLFSTSPGALFCLALSLGVLAVILRKRMIPVFVALGVVAAAVAFLSFSVVTELFSNVPALVLNTLAEQERILIAVFSRDWFQVLFGSPVPSEMSLNFWGDFLFRFGLSGAMAFSLFLIYLFRKGMRVWSCTKDMKALRLSFGLQLSIGMLLFRGITSPFTDNSTVFGFFWLVCGMLCGVSNVAKASSPRDMV